MDDIIKAHSATLSRAQDALQSRLTPEDFDILQLMEHRQINLLNAAPVDWRDRLNAAINWLCHLNH